MSAVPSSLMPALPTPGGPRHGADLRSEGPAEAFAGLFLDLPGGHHAAPADSRLPALASLSDGLPEVAQGLADRGAPADAGEGLHHVASQLQWLRGGQAAMPWTDPHAGAGAASAGLAEANATRMAWQDRAIAAARLPGLQPGALDAAAAAVDRAAQAQASAPVLQIAVDGPMFDARQMSGQVVASQAGVAAALAAASAQADPGAGGALHGLTPLPTSPLMTPVRADGLLPPLPGQALPPGADPFTDGVASRMAWMAGQKLGRAEIRLSPAELGTIDIRLELDGKQVRAEFGSAHADVRAALEAGMQRLRDMLAGQGLNLVQADVGDGGPSSRGDRGQGLGADGGGNGRGSADPGHAQATDGTGEDATVQTRFARHDGILDTYA